MSMTHYGLPYILEDTTGRLSGSDFPDIHERMHFSVRCTAHDVSRTAYLVYGSSVRVGLEFGTGKDNVLGTISFVSVKVPMEKYLVGSAQSRHFVGSDGETYQWARRTHPNQEWTCTTAAGHIVASYSLKTAGEPEYHCSSGCILEIAEQFGGLASEILASLWIMRHIAACEQS